MNHFYIVANKVKDKDYSVAEQMKKELLSADETAEVIIGSSAKKLNEIPADTQCLIVLGGDGTVLLAAKQLTGKEIPMLGVNLGTVGYLTEVEPSGLREAAQKLVKNDFVIENRMMLEGFVQRKKHENADSAQAEGSKTAGGMQSKKCENVDGAQSKVENNAGYFQNETQENAGSMQSKDEEGECFAKSEAKETGRHALNDIVLTRCGELQVIGYRIFVNGMYLKDFYADGVILSTPTGSTGYNLSAGGSIVEPSAKLIVLTPVCPHTLNTRSIILSPEDKIEIEILPAKGEKPVEVAAYFDGGTGVKMIPGDRLKVNRSKYITRICKLSDVSFLEVLHHKISE